MITTVETASDIIDMLNDLIQLDYDAIQAYEAAIPRFDNGKYQAQLAAFRDDHARHVRELDSVIRGLHGKPINGSLINLVVTAGKIAFADMIGDELILQALKSEEDETNKAYERVASRGDLPPSVVPVIQNALGDERRHRDWIEKTITAS